MPFELNKTFSNLVINAEPCGTSISGSFEIPYEAEYKVDYLNNDLFHELFATSNATNKKKFSLFDMLEDAVECEELTIERIIFNDPATVIFWSDGEKTVVKTAEGDTYSPYYGFCCAVAKRIFGNNSAIKKIMKRKGNIDSI